jgi:uncharacterized protein YciI
MDRLQMKLAGLALATLLGCASMSAQAQEGAREPAAAKSALKQYVYVLRPVPRLHDQAAWTERDKALTSAHFQRLRKATDSGQVILAGRTSEDLAKTFGLVIFEAENDTAAEAFMRADPAVDGGVMTATLHPYSVALQRKR